jgi:hypothetical protein
LLASLREEILIAARHDFSLRDPVTGDSTR